MNLTSIKKNKNGKYEVIIDNKKYLLYDDTLIKFNLLKAKTIDNFDDIKEYNDLINGYYIAIKYISNKYRTKNEIIKKLLLNNISKDNTLLIIDRLEKEKYLNDDMYIKAYIHDKNILSLEGPYKILNDLVKLGFKETNVNKYLNYSGYDDKVNKIILKKVKRYKSSYKKLILELKNDLYKYGYNEDYFYLLNNILYDESKALEKDKLKYTKLYDKKYDDKKREFMINNKLKSLGYDI